MSTITEGNHITAEAGADLHDKRNYIVKFDGNGKVVLATAATDEIIGVLSDVPQGATGSCAVAHVSGNGTGKVVASTNIAKGLYLTAAAGGQAVNTTTSTHRVFGRSREAALAQGDVIEYEKMFFIY